MKQTDRRINTSVRQWALLAILFLAVMLTVLLALRAYFPTSTGLSAGGGR